MPELDNDTIVADPEHSANENEPTQFAKGYAGEIKADDDERSFVATITTETVDRDGDVVLAKGLDFENFLKNPVVLLGHPMGIEGIADLPIGRATWIKAKGRKVIAEVAPAPTDMGNEVFDLIKGGFLNAVSIGFRSIDAGPPTEKELRKHPEWAGANRIFRESELVEFSVVNVPANPDALISAIRKGHIRLSAPTMQAFFEHEIYPPQPERSIKRIVTMVHSPIMRPIIIPDVPLDAKQIRCIAERTVQTARGRLVPVNTP